MLLPRKACFAPGEPVIIDLPGDPPAGTRQAAEVVVEHLGQVVATCAVTTEADHVNLPPLPEGGYAVGLRTSDGTTVAHTAVEVLADPVSRLRYGFVASFAPDRDLDGVLRNFRRLHLTGAQFYDWAYRHADLLGRDATGGSPGSASEASPADAEPGAGAAPAPGTGLASYTDPLGQPVSVATIRSLAGGLHDAGTLPIGYAAVYGVGNHEWPRWAHAGLLRPDGTPHSLEGFLSIVDPGDPGWLAHFRADLRGAVAAIGFAGFHLDQYGFPRRAVRPDGREVDLAAAFDTLLQGVRAELPDATLVFNNVNDFPVWATTRSPVDVTYTEVWEPHDTLADLAAVATRARRLAPRRPAVLAAYQSVFDREPAGVSEVTARLTMATLFSHGATQLLAGEAGSVLVDPYYVRNHPAESSTLDMLARWYDLLVAAGDLLFAPEAVDITRSVVGGLNGEIDVLAGDGCTVTHRAEPGVVWRRVVQTPHGVVVHLINLTGQTETGWDTAKAPVPPVSGLRLRVRRNSANDPVIRVADPEEGPFFTEVPASADGEYLVVDLPALHAWQIVFLGRS